MKIALQACQCSAWFQMDAELRSHIQTTAGLTFVPSEVKRRVETFKPRVSVGYSIHLVVLFDLFFSLSLSLKITYHIWTLNFAAIDYIFGFTKCGLATGEDSHKSSTSTGEQRTFARGKVQQAGCESKVELSSWQKYVDSAKRISWHPK